MNAVVWNEGRWSLHLFPLSPALIRTIDGAQARFLRRILKVPAAYLSRVSHRSFRLCSTMSFSTYIFRSQLHCLGHILRKPPTHPLRLVLFQPNTDLDPRRPPTYDRVTKAVRGRPILDWGQALSQKIHRLSGKTKRDLAALAQDRHNFHRFIKRLRRLADQMW